MTQPTFNLLEVFSVNELRSAKKRSVNELERDFVRPKIAEINRITGQENDSRYLAYAMHYALATLEQGS